MGATSTTNNCVPEAPDITVNVYSVAIGGTGANYHHDVFGIGDSQSSAGLVFTLSHTPVQSLEVVVTVNGSVQRPTTDYTLVGTTLTLATALPSGEICAAHYLGTT